MIPFDDILFTKSIADISGVVISQIIRAEEVVKTEFWEQFVRKCVYTKMSVIQLSVT